MATKNKPAVKKEDDADEVKIPCTYHIKSGALDNFEAYVSAVKKHARLNKLGPVSRQDVIVFVFKKLDTAKAKDFFKK